MVPLLDWNRMRSWKWVHKGIRQYMQDTCIVVAGHVGRGYFPHVTWVWGYMYNREISRLCMTQCGLQSMRAFFFFRKSHRCPSEGQICMWEGRWLAALKIPQRHCLRQIEYEALNKVSTVQYCAMTVQYCAMTVWEQLMELWPTLQYLLGQLIVQQ